ncbi:glycoside hydrolase/deacetylase [Rhizodiscina lignyota]|uniref:Glycoside hydrolase/deacetylase n=1 Tax=Rhizodiscina lignyota TaxID=1504668 RepID=A0A9P4IF20_9PEZI|nr:glycoside hydrolase/deacetylase [Rhizodiscina lignyota]
MIQDAKYQFPRDFEGYGQQGRDAQWPGGARIAISLCLNYEEGGEMTVLNGDPHAETMNWEKSGGPPFVNARQPNVESEYEYGSRSGIWRLMRVFSQFNYPFTLYAVGQALEKNPAVGKACVAAGHEIAGHGYRWVDFKDWHPVDEKEDLKKGIRAIQNICGVSPKGWYVGRGSPNSTGLVYEAFKEMGIPLEWEADCYSDDVPMWLDVPSALSGDETKQEGLLHLPYSYDRNDMKFHLAADGFGGESWYQYLVDSFDMLYAEGGKMMSIGLHARIVGKPGRARALQKFFEYVSMKEGVWVTTRAEIAQHWRSKYPYKPSTS